MAGTEIPQGALKTDGQGFFLGGSVVKTLLTNAGGTGLIPWARRIPLAVGQPSACATARACAPGDRPDLGAEPCLSIAGGFFTV